MRKRFVLYDSLYDMQFAAFDFMVTLGIYYMRQNGQKKQIGLRVMR